VTKLIILVIAIVLIGYYFARPSAAKPEAIADAKKAGAEFMETNKTEEGVITTASGLQYQVLQVGTGTEHPSATDRVKVHYEGKLLDGTMFDSSVKRGEPITFGLNQVISGWTEGVQLMVVGEAARFVIPAEMAYGDKRAGKIPAGSTLIFDVELLGINE